MTHSTQQQRGISMTVFVLCTVVSCILGIFFAKYWHTNNKKSAFPGYEFVGTVLKNPRALSEFHLTATDGTELDEAALKGHWSLVFFGFTHCPKMCPTAMHELAVTYQLLQKDKVNPMPKVMMVSVDPKRDSLERMKNYVEGFNKDFIGAIGSNKEVRKLSTEMGIAYEKVASRDGAAGEYDFQHSGAVIVLNPKGEIKAFFNWPHKPSEMAMDYTNLIS